MSTIGAKLNPNLICPHCGKADFTLSVFVADKVFCQHCRRSMMIWQLRCKVEKYSPPTFDFRSRRGYNPIETPYDDEYRQAQKGVIAQTIKQEQAMRKKVREDLRRCGLLVIK